MADPTVPPGIFIRFLQKLFQEFLQKKKLGMSLTITRWISYQVPSSISLRGFQCSSWNFPNTLKKSLFLDLQKTSRRTHELHQAENPKGTPDEIPKIILRGNNQDNSERSREQQRQECSKKFKTNSERNFG